MFCKVPGSSNDNAQVYNMSVDDDSVNEYYILNDVYVSQHLLKLHLKTLHIFADFSHFIASNAVLHNYF